MDAVLFWGDIESPHIIEVIEQIVLTHKKVIISLDTYKKIRNMKDGIRQSIMTWSWYDDTANFYVYDEIIELLQYIYPDTIDPNFLDRQFNTKYSLNRTFTNFRLGFGVQEELFDLFLSHIFQVSEMIYFDISSSLQLLNPVYQFEYRKRSYEFMKYINQEEIELSKKRLIIKHYNITDYIPFYEKFSEKYGYSKLISHYYLSNRIGGDNMK